MTEPAPLPANPIRKLLLGFALRCPNCEQGRIYKWGNLFHMEEKCAYCDVRFERSQGESIGGVFIALTVAEFVSVAGFFIFEALFSPDPLFQFLFWATFVLLFSILTYRHWRSLWVAISYLTGGVKTDESKTNPEVIVSDGESTSHTPEKLEG